MIDIAIEAMEQYLADNPRFVNRGDPANPDWELGDFTLNSSWHTLDMSSIIPTNARGVLLRGDCLCQAVGWGVHFKTKGNVNSPNMSAFAAQTADVGFQVDTVVIPNTNREIIYMGYANVFTQLEVTVGGWWL